MNGRHSLIGDLKARYLRPNFAFRFSTNALIPSCPSAVPPVSAMERLSSSICVSRVWFQPPCSSLLADPNAPVGPCAKYRASSSARDSRFSGGTTSVTMPHSHASRADSTRFVNANSIARLSPTSLGRKYVEPPSGAMPIFEYAIKKLEDSAAITRSQEIAKLKPPPAAGPCTAAITGASSRAKREIARCRKK